MGGLAAGSAIAGRLAMRMTRTRGARLRGAGMRGCCGGRRTPGSTARDDAAFFAWAYRDGDGGLVFASLRLAASILLLLLPTLALGRHFRSPSAALPAAGSTRRG